MQPGTRHSVSYYLNFLAVCLLLRLYFFYFFTVAIINLIEEAVFSFKNVCVPPAQPHFFLYSHKVLRKKCDVRAKIKAYMNIFKFKLHLLFIFFCYLLSLLCIISYIFMTRCINSFIILILITQLFSAFSTIFVIFVFLW